MTGQPFLRLDAFPPLSRKTWNVKQSVVLCWRGIHRFFWVFVGLWRRKLLTFVIPHGTGIPVGRVGRHFSVSHELQWECPPSGALTCESCQCLHLRARAAMGEYFVARQLPTFSACASWLHHTLCHSHTKQAGRLRRAVWATVSQRGPLATVWRHLRSESVV